MTATTNEEILDILTVTPWDSETIRDAGKKEMLQNQRNCILSLLQYEVGPPSSVSNKTKNSSSRNKGKRDELDSYDALVRDAGMIFLDLLNQLADTLYFQDIRIPRIFWII